MLGTWNLHRATLHIPLNFFVMFSSVSSLLGNVAQSSYSAANLFMDSFASYRRAMNLPATSINWGVIADVGFVARNSDFSEMLNNRGVLMVRPTEAYRALKLLLFEGSVDVLNSQVIPLFYGS